MSIKTKVLAAAATLTLVGGVGMAGALTAGPAVAATPSCGGSCVNTFNEDFTGLPGSGSGATIDVYRQGERVGQPIILFRTSNSDPALDWSMDFQGTVADFLAAGLVSLTTALHYGCTSPPFTAAQCSLFPNDLAFEIEYAPYGVDSGLCMGVAVTAFQGEGVTLQPCGVSAKTVWIVDTVDNQFPTGFFPLINGSNTNFSHPFVLTYPQNANPVDRPRPQVEVTNLTGFTQPGPPFFPVISSVTSTQLWTQTFGVLP